MVLFIFLQAPVVRAQSQSKIAVLNLSDSGVGEKDAARISEALRAEVKSLVGRRLKKSPASTICALENLVPCAAELGKKLGADVVLAGTVAALADAQLIDLRLIDVGSKTELSRLQSPLSGVLKKDRKILRELAVRLLLPENYTGQLLLAALDAGDELLVDGALVSAKAGVPVTLAVGPHVVELMRGKETLGSKVVNVSYEQTVELDFSAGSTVGKAGGHQGDDAQAPQVHEISAVSADAPVSADQAPAQAAGSVAAKNAQNAEHVNWPMWAAVGLGAVSLATTIGLISYYFSYVQPRLAVYNVDGMRTQVIAEPGDPVIGYEYYHQLAVQTQIGIVATVLVTIASGGAATYFALNNESGEEAPAK